MSSYPFAPREPSPVHASRRERKAGIPWPRLQVLVVDDDAQTRQALARAIAELGHACRVAHDGPSALEQIAEAPVDVVISDWEMPRMSGAELCERIRRADVESPYTYFIMLTSFQDRDHLFAAMEAGADDYQRKPVELDELEARLVSAARVVDLHRRLASKTAALRHDSQKLYAASRTDALTGAGNRLHLDEELNRALSRARRYGHKSSLAMCDLDFFKAFNDQLGHVAGDDALRRIAETMRASLRSGDALFRYGGEEFAVLLAEQTVDDAVRVMERVRAAVERLGLPCAKTGGAMTMSVGVAELDTERDRSPIDWIGRADAALYAAKQRGRNRVLPSCPRHEA